MSFVFRASYFAPHIRNKVFFRCVVVIVVFFFFFVRPKHRESFAYQKPYCTLRVYNQQLCEFIFVTGLFIRRFIS